MTRGEPVQPRSCPRAVVLMLDLVDFTRMVAGLEGGPRELLGLMNALFCRLDGASLTRSASASAWLTTPSYRCLAALVEAAGLWKAETIGDAYIVVATGDSDAPPAGWADLSRAAAVAFGEPGALPPLAAGSGGDSAVAAAASAARLRGRFQLEAVFALADRMLAELASLRERSGLPIHCRIGIHTGSVVTGLIGSKRPRYCAYDSPSYFCSCHVLSLFESQITIPVCTSPRQASWVRL